MAVTFQRRSLRFTFHLATAVFNKEGNPDKVEIEDFRSSVEVNNTGGFDFATCRGKIYGLDQETMERLTLIYDGVTAGVDSNVLVIEATDETGAFSIIFRGEILHSAAEFNGAPDVYLEFSARAGIIGTLRAAYSRSFPGARKVSDMIEGLAKELGYTFENNGANTVLVDQVLYGSPMEMIQRLKAAANIEMHIDTAENVLAIAPQGVPRESEPVIVSSETGLIGWPRKIAYYIEFMMLYTPDIKIGCKIDMQSDYAICNGDWYIRSVNLNLSCNMPGGPWFTEYSAGKSKLAATK